MIGLSRTANGSMGGGYGFEISGVGVCAIPQIDGADPQADRVSDKMTRITKVRCMVKFELYPPGLSPDELTENLIKYVCAVQCFDGLVAACEVAIILYAVST